MTDKKGEMSYPVPVPKGTPCPDCGLPWETPGSLHGRAPAGSVCGIDGCKKRPFTECFVGAERVGVWCVTGGHRWRKAVVEQAPRCSRCGRDAASLLVADSGPLCLGCVEQVGDASGVDPEAVAALRALSGAPSR